MTNQIYLLQKFSRSWLSSSNQSFRSTSNILKYLHQSSINWIKLLKNICDTNIKDKLCLDNELPTEFNEENNLYSIDGALLVWLMFNETWNVVIYFNSKMNDDNVLRSNKLNQQKIVSIGWQKTLIYVCDFPNNTTLWHISIMFESIFAYLLKKLANRSIYI